MLPEKIMQSDLLDILFDNRNKSYGAYALRKSYNKTLASAITITLFIAIAFSVFQFMHHTKKITYVIPVIIPPDNIFSAIEPVKPQPVKPVPQHAVIHSRQIITSPPVIINNDVKMQMPTVDEEMNNAIGNKNIIGKGDIDVIQPPANTQHGTGITATTASEINADDKPLNYAQFMPEYPGGLDALRKFMLKNLRQPDDLQAGEKIIVMATFVVNKTGQIEQVKIMNAGRPDLNKEVQRVINKMPYWKPGIQNGNAVAVYFNLPVTFMSAEEE